MESMYNDLRNRGETLDNTKTTRLPTRTLGPGGTEVAFLDFGSTLGTSVPKKSVSTVKKPGVASKSNPTATTRPSSSQSNLNANTQRNRNNRNVNASGIKASAAQNAPWTRLEPIDISEDSEDEMDLLSSQPDDPSASQIPVPRSKYPSAGNRDVRASKPGPSSRKQASIELSQGDTIDPKFLTQKTVLSQLKFKKNKTDSSQASSQSLLCSNAMHDDAKPPMYDRTATENDEVIVLDMPVNTKPMHSNRHSSPQPPPKTRRDTPRDAPLRNKNSLTSQKTQIGAPPPRPKPRPALPGRANMGMQAKKATHGPSSSQLPKSRTMLDMVDCDRSKNSHWTKRRSRSRSSSLGSSPVGRSKKKSAPDAFPALSPMSSQPQALGDFPFMSPLRDSEAQKTTRETAKPKPSNSRLPDPFPSLSPPKKVGKPAAVTSTKLGKETGKARIIYSSEEDENLFVSPRKEKSRREKPEKKLEEFPMATQLLASIGSPSAPAIWDSPTSYNKRSSEAGSGDEHRSKKSRWNRESLMASPSRNHFDYEGDSISIVRHVDPKTLCPYCDTPLPSSPSPFLLRLLATTKNKSYKDPRPSNFLGRRAPLTVFVTVCQRHRFESQILPEAEKKGWPKTIDWSEVEGRTIRMKESLQALIEDPCNLENIEARDDDWEVLHTNQKAKNGTKSKSIFWMEVMDDVKKKGLKAVSGVREQFANFEKAQPGYYGELGSVIIHQTLYNLFPLARLDAALVSPLTANEFVQRILVPEVALRLIMEDLCLEGDDGMRTALTVLRDSSAYGVAMFPEDDTGAAGRKKWKEDDQMGVGDMIVMERARKRRKELEEEEEEEEEEQRTSANRERELQERLYQKREDKATKKKGKAKQTEELVSSSSEVREILAGERPRPRPRPRPATKLSSATDVMAATDLGQDTPRVASNRSRSRSTYSSMDTDSDTPSDTHSLFDGPDEYRRPSSRERIRSLSASETRNDAYEKPMLTTRAPSRGVASMRLDSDSDASTKARDGKEIRASSKSNSRKDISDLKRTHPERMAVNNDSDSDNKIEFVPNKLSPETPMARRHVSKSRTTHAMEEDENTPRPTKVDALPPLERARERRLAAKPPQASGSELKAAAAKPSKLGLNGKRLPGTRSVLTDTEHVKSNVDDHKYDWLLNESSQSSVERESRRR